MFKGQVPWANGSIPRIVSYEYLPVSDEEGNTRYVRHKMAITWCDNVPFFRVLTLRYYCGTYVTWYDQDDNLFTMFASDLVQIALQQAEFSISGGVAAGYWIAVKKGKAYGIVPYFKDKE